MNISISKSDSLLRLVAIDALLVAAICAIPAASHALAFPLYKLNPMLLALFVGMGLVRNRRNGFILALAMPLISMLITGMPILANALCMVPELITVVALFIVLERRMPAFLAVVAAALAGKVVFYLFRALFFAPATLIGTSLTLQLAAIIAAALLYVAILKIRFR